MPEETAAADLDDPGRRAAAAEPVRRAAVVIHPGKHDDVDGFRAVVRQAMSDLGWAEPLWLETTPDDTGERLAREAVRSGADLVLASGGDGTITACAGGVAGSGVPLRADGGPPQRRWASGVIAGNVGSLQGNVRLLPDAAPDDGVLDVAVLAASGWTGWLWLAADVLLRRRTGRVAQLTCRELTVDAGRARPWEVDGEVAGTTRQLRVTLEPGSLLVRVPAGTAG